MVSSIYLDAWRDGNLAGILYKVSFPPAKGTVCYDSMLAMTHQLHISITAIYHLI